MITIYGLKNCDTCRKALKWLKENNTAHSFIDIRAETPSVSEIATWVQAVGTAVLVNKSSTTWRGLDDTTKESLTNANAADLLVENPTLIKRPVFVSGKTVIVGFKDAQKKSLEELQ